MDTSEPPANLLQPPEYRHTTRTARQKSHLDDYKESCIFTPLDTTLSLA